MTQADAELLKLARRIAETHLRDGERRTADIILKLVARVVALSLKPLPHNKDSQ
jgi:hypothetical protein